MTGELTIFKTGATPSLKFKGADLPTQRLDDGVSAGFARVSYKGSKWGIRYQGAYTPIQARMPDGTIIQSPFLDVVILKAAGHPNKAWYEGAYQEGAENSPPDCWSSSGFAPDPASPKKQSTTCRGCDHNVWGSKVNRDTGQATRGKACMDSKRIAVVPVGDIMNITYGGPMMLSVPPSSLKRLGPYQNMLQAGGFHYAAVWTRITFDGETSYPLFNFDAITPLNDAQADQVLEMVKHPVIERILDAESAAVEAWDESAQSVHSSIGAGSTSDVKPSAEEIAAKAEADAVQRMNDAMAKAAAERAAAQAAAASTLPDPGPIPAQLVRTAPTTAPSPSVAPAEIEAEAPDPIPDTPEATPAPPAGFTLPPGMTPEMAAAFMAQFGQQAQAPRRRRRTAPVSPAGNQPSVAGPGLPVAATPGRAEMVVTPPPVPVTNGAGIDPVAQIMGTIGKLT